LKANGDYVGSRIWRGPVIIDTTAAAAAAAAAAASAAAASAAATCWCPRHVTQSTFPTGWFDSNNFAIR